MIVVMGTHPRRQNTGSGLVPSGSSLPQRYDRLFGAGLVNGIPEIGRYGSRAPDPVRSGALRQRFEENIHLPTMSPGARSRGYPISRISFEMSWPNLPIVCHEISRYDTRNQNLMLYHFIELGKPHFISLNLDPFNASTPLKKNMSHLRLNAEYKHPLPTSHCPAQLISIPRLRTNSRQRV